MDDGDERSDSFEALHGVNEDYLASTLFDGLNEPLSPLEPPSSEPHSNSLPSGGQPSSPASVPLSPERIRSNNFPILPPYAEGNSHSYSLSSGGPGTGSHELPSLEQSGNVLLTDQDPLPGLSSINVSLGEESDSDSVPPTGHDVNENVRQSEGFTSTDLTLDVSPGPDTIFRTFSDNRVAVQAESDNPILAQNSRKAQGLTFTEGHPRVVANTEGLHAARVLRDMVQGSAVSSLVASSQQAPLHNPHQQSQPASIIPENSASNVLKVNHFNPVGCPSSAQIIPNCSVRASPRENVPVRPYIHPFATARPSTTLYHVGNRRMGGNTPAAESHFPQSNSLSSTVVQGSTSSKVLTGIVIDRALLEKAGTLERGLHKSPEFGLFSQLIRQKYRESGRFPIGGTMKRRTDLVKPIENLDDFGYPPCDRHQVHKILDTTPGLDRDTVEYLKLSVLCQLDRIRQGAREALHQLSAILIDHLRFRIMTQNDILDLQCKVVDRFVVARDCVLERYSHYARSRRWIENKSTNQRRGCLTHQQNNIMRMWLYQNFKSPYPDEVEKAYIEEETKLTMEQVNNWLINARSRFWKPAMDYFERDPLEAKMSAIIRNRLKMTPQARANAVRTIGSASTTGKRKAEN